MYDLTSNFVPTTMIRYDNGAHYNTNMIYLYCNGKTDIPDDTDYRQILNNMRTKFFYPKIPSTFRFTINPVSRLTI